VPYERKIWKLTEKAWKKPVIRAIMR